MKTKYYAVRKGNSTGIFKSWAECENAIKGFRKAEYKSFPTMEEAEAFINGTTPGKRISEEQWNLADDELIVYVDGSYDDALQKYSFGCIILKPNGEIITKCGNGSNPASLAIRNVAGEMLGAMFATRWAMVNGYHRINIRYDYAGIEKWVTGEWKAKNELTQKYAAAMNNWARSIAVTFTKIPAHAGNKYNEEADRLAKSALNDANGIPKIEKE